MPVLIELTTLELILMQVLSLPFPLGTILPAPRGSAHGVVGRSIQLLIYPSYHYRGRS